MRPVANRAPPTTAYFIHSGNASGEALLDKGFDAMDGILNLLSRSSILNLREGIHLNGFDEIPCSFTITVQSTDKLPTLINDEVINDALIIDNVMLRSPALNLA